MSKMNIYDKKGTVVGEMDFPSEKLVLDKGGQAVKDAVTAYRNALRSGNASTLSKGEVAGSNRKPWRQKGTGQARAGFRQSPVWRGGGVAFGPKPRSYELKVNRKVAKLAFKRALSEKINSGSIKIINELDIAEPKTKAVAAILKALGIKKPVLVVVDNVTPSIGLACRNIARAELAEAREVNVYQLLRYSEIVATRAAVEELCKRLDGSSGSEKIQ